MRPLHPLIVIAPQQLPPQFIRAIPSVREADLLIVMGTSLTVHPFASLAGLPAPGCPRVLINLDHVGDFGNRADDVVLLGKCDEIVRDLCRELGWEEELMRLWEETGKKGASEEAQAGGGQEEETGPGKAEAVDAEKEVEKLAEAIGGRLGLKDDNREENEGSKEWELSPSKEGEEANAELEGAVTAPPPPEKPQVEDDHPQTEKPPAGKLKNPGGEAPSDERSKPASEK